MSEPMMPLVTVIMSMYNAHEYLRECVDSILSQTYMNLQVILVDDGSPDDSGRIADEYQLKDNRVTVIHKDNSGVSDSRNAGLKIAQGDYIAIVDQDDVLANDYVEYFMNLIDTYHADIATTPQPDKFFGEPHTDAAPDDTVFTYSGHDATEQMLYHKFVIAPWNKLVSAKLLNENGIRFNPAFFGGEGFAFSIECFEHAKTVAVGQRKVYHYRVGDPNSGASKYRESSIKSSLAAQEYIREHLVDRSARMKKAWEFSKWHTYCDQFNMMVGCKAKKRNPSLYRMLKRYCRANAYVAFSAPISAQQKLRGVLFLISPRMAAMIINRFRVRKFQPES